MPFGHRPNERGRSPAQLILPRPFSNHIFISRVPEGNRAPPNELMDNRFLVHVLPESVRVVGSAGGKHRRIAAEGAPAVHQIAYEGGSTAIHADDKNWRARVRIV